MGRRAFDWPGERGAPGLGGIGRAPVGSLFETVASVVEALARFTEVRSRFRCLSRLGCPSGLRLLLDLVEGLVDRGLGLLHELVARLADGLPLELGGRQ